MRTSIAQLPPVSQERNLLQKRELLRRNVWSESGSAGGGPNTIDTDGTWTDSRLGRTNISRVDRLKFNLPWGLWAYVYHVVPATQAATRRAMLIHQGHDPWYGGLVDTTATYFLSLGYDVFLFGMPTWLPNPPLDPTDPGNAFNITLEDGVSTLSYLDHGSIATLFSGGTQRTNPLRLYLDPPIRTITYAIETLGVPGSRIFMQGLSGGGWTTHMVGVFDDRPAGIYGVAGFMPHDSGEPTDYETAAQNPIYLVSEVREMFAIAGLRRRHVQCLNNLDYAYRYASNVTYPTRTAYVDAYVADVQSRLGGNTIGYFALHVDTTTAEQQHIISLSTRTFIATDIASYIT